MEPLADAWWEFQCSPSGDRVVLHGEYDLHSTPAMLAAHRASCGGSGLLSALDLREVSFGDSSIVHMLRDAAAACAREGRRPQVVLRPGSPLARVLELMGTASMLDVQERR